MGQKYDVLVVGSYSVDLIFAGLPHMPEIGAEVVGSQFAMLPGEAYTSAVAMHRLGLKVAWAGDFGNDDLSRFVLEQAQAEGLDPGSFVHHERPLRRISVAASFPHDRAFITYYDPDPAVPAALKALASVSARVLYVPGFFFGPLLAAGAALARARRMKIVMDGNSGKGVSLQEPGARKAVQSVDVFLPNAREARCLTGEEDLSRAMQTLAALGPLVVIKNGPQGSLAWSASGCLEVPSLALTPLDTTGAGDCYSAGFLKAWLDGQPLETCLKWGNVVGGLSTLALGGSGQVVTCDEVQRWLGKLGSSSSG